MFSDPLSAWHQLKDESTTPTASALELIHQAFSQAQANYTSSTGLLAETSKLMTSDGNNNTFAIHEALGQQGMDLKNHLMMESPMTQTSESGQNQGFMDESSLSGSPGLDFMPDVDPDELGEFIKHDEDYMLDEIRRFVANHQLRQQTIAQMTRISQPYVSKFLRGEGRDISSRVKQTMYCWFLSCRKNPDRLAAFRAENSQRITLTEAGGEVVVPRRERFVFRPCHVAALESFYMLDPYPDHAKREEIANACNQALIKERGGALHEKEYVQAQVVANWFANKRKEHKKQMGGALPLPHGYHPYSRRGRKPSVYYSGVNQMMGSFYMHPATAAALGQYGINGDITEETPLHNHTMNPNPAPTRETESDSIPEESSPGDEMSDMESDEPISLKSASQCLDVSKEFPSRSDATNFANNHIGEPIQSTNINDIINKADVNIESCLKQYPLSMKGVQARDLTLGASAQSSNNDTSFQ